MTEASDSNPHQLHNDILECIRLGYTIPEIAVATLTNEGNVSNHIHRALKHHEVERVGKGRYRLIEPAPQPEPKPEPPAPPLQPNDRHQLVIESDRRKVIVPEYLRLRQPVSLFITRSEEEIQKVVALWICKNGEWTQLPLHGNIRICIGDERPNWPGGTQVSYDGVQAYRVTLRNGDEFDATHNPNVPFTIDQHG